MVVKSSLAKMLANSDDLASRPHWTGSELVFGKKQVIPALQQLFLAYPMVHNESIIWTTPAFYHR
jgi:hypothetical protein